MRKEIVEKAGNIISELVYNKTTLLKAYNYYNNKLDAELYKYLEENYGLGLPTSVLFVPLIRKHVDALVGEYLNTPILPKVSCKDEKTINNIFRDKLLKIASEVHNLLYSNLKNNILLVIGNKDMTDLNIKELLDKLIEDINENYISEYEIAGLNIIQYIIQSRDIDLINKLRLLLVDLLVTGYAFYRVIKEDESIQIEVLSPLNTFIDFNYDSPYIKNSYRAVVRHYLTKTQILNKYGKDLSKEDISKIEECWTDESFYVRTFENRGVPAADVLFNGESSYRDTLKTIPVYEVEWLETDSDYVMHRYSATRIGQEIYIVDKEDTDVVRTKANPSKCTLRTNGIYYNNRNSEPYSLVMACLSVQDKYNLAIFYRDSLLANSGTSGDWINIPNIPTFLGENLPERILKWIAYKKLGTALIDTSQEGVLNTGLAPLNLTFNGYDDTIKALAIQAILMTIDSLEATASSITGVFRERLNGILLRDAVTNVLVGINNSFTVTKLWFFEMDLILNEILTDSLNQAKSVYKKGLTGTLILGHKLQKVFTALPEHFTNTDFDIHIITSSEIMREMEQIKQLVPELVKSGFVTPDILVDIISSLSLTEMRSYVKKAFKKQKAENDVILKLSQLLEEALNNLLQMQSQLLLAQNKIELLNEAKLQIEQQKIQLQNQVEVYKAKTDRAYKENTAKNDNKRTEIELLQLRDGNPYNDKIRQI